MVAILGEGANSVGRDHPNGALAFQATNGCASREVPSASHGYGMLRSSFDNRGYAEREVTFHRTIRSGRRCRACAQQVQSWSVLRLFLTQRCKLICLEPADNSDFLTIHSAFSSWRNIINKGESARKFCRDNYLSHQVRLFTVCALAASSISVNLKPLQNLQQVEEIRQQFLGYLLDSGFIQADKGFQRELSRYAG